MADDREPSLEARAGAGRSLLQLGRGAEAVEPVHRALELDAGDEATRYDLAVALAMSGQIVEAREVAESLLRENDQHRGAAVLLRRLESAR